MPFDASVLLLGALLLVEAPSPASVPAPGVLSRGQADDFARKLAAVKERQRLEPGRRRPAQVLVSETELNSWLAYEEDTLPTGVTEMRVQLLPERLAAQGQVDLSLLKPKVQLSPLHPLYWLSGIVQVDVAGRVRSEGGTATVEWEDVRVGSIPVSPSLLQQMVITATRNSKRYPGGFDVLAPFKLPYDARRVQLDARRALVEF